MYFQSLGQEDPLEEKMTTHSSILARKIPWTKDPGGLQAMGSHVTCAKAYRQKDTVNLKLSELQ